jgi:NADH-quinone oxidoreductase subunit M
MIQNIPYLSLLIYFPILGVAGILFLNKNNEYYAKYIAFITSLIELILSIPLFFHNYTNEKWSFVEKITWIKSYDIKYYLGIDGVSMLLILLTTLLSFVAIWSSFSYIQEKEREYYISLLLLEVSVIGIFASLDLMLMYVFLGFMMIPMYILIVIWGSGNKEYVAFKFFIYTAFGSFINFIGILALAFYHKEVNGFITFDIDKLYGLSLPIIFERWIFLAFFLGFGIKAAIFPLHTWLPDVHTEAPTAGSVMLAGVLLKVGTYGFFRFVMPLFPNATKFFAPYIIILAIISIIYGALVSLVQTDVKKLIAYSSISHLGFIMLGLE